MNPEQTLKDMQKIDRAFMEVCQHEDRDYDDNGIPYCSDCGYRLKPDPNLVAKAEKRRKTMSKFIMLPNVEYKVPIRVVKKGRRAVRKQLNGLTRKRISIAQFLMFGKRK